MIARGMNGRFSAEAGGVAVVEQRGALRKARDLVAGVLNDKTVFGWSAVGAILVGCWFIRGIAKDVDAVATGLADVRIEMRSGLDGINARMATLVTREQADDLVMRRLAEARLAGK